MSYFFVIKANSNDLIWPKWYETAKKETSCVDTLLIYAIWYEFSNDFDAQSDFGKFFVKKKSTNLDHSYLKYALATD